MTDIDKTCRQFEEDLVAYVDGELADDRKSEIEAHLEACAACAAVVDDLRSVGQKLQAWKSPEPRKEWETQAEASIRKRASRKGFGAIVLHPAFALSMAAGLVLVVIAIGLTKYDRYFEESYASASKKQEVLIEKKGVSPRILAKAEKRWHQERRPPERSNNQPGQQNYEHRGIRTFGEAIAQPAEQSPGYALKKRPSDRSRYKVSGPVTELPKTGDEEVQGRLAIKTEPWSSVDGVAGNRSSSLSLSQPGHGAQSTPASADPNAYYASNYQGGAGDRERVEKLIEAGVVVEGGKVKLETFTRRYAKSLPVPSRTSLAVSANTDRGTVLASGGEVFLQVGIQGTKREMPRRPPLNIALVIDRSGSMAGSNKMASAKAAALRFVDALRSDDRVTVIAYDSEINLESNRRRLKAFIRGLHPNGSTNIHGALDAAYRAIARQHSPERIASVILLSDGIPTAGNTSEAAIVDISRTAAENSIGTTTVGVGLDYNDSLMMGVARQGQGHYHFVKDASSIGPILKKEFDALNRVVARALRLRIRLSDGVVLRRVLGSAQLSHQEVRQVRTQERRVDDKLYRELGIKKDRDVDDEEGIKMLIPYFFSGDSHVVMLQLSVPPGTERKKIAQVTLKYKDMVFGRNGFDERDAVVERSQDEDEVVASISRPVKKNLLGMRAGEALLTASQFVSRGDVARAGRMLDEQAILFEEAARAWGDRELAEDARLLRRYAAVVTTLGDPALAGRESLRAYLSKTMSHSGYRLVQ